LEETDDEEDEENIFTEEDSGSEKFLVADEYEKVYANEQFKCTPVQFFKHFFSGKNFILIFNFLVIFIFFFKR
jgi:hypothetical protein